ncbi:2-C-methyl-D-erythritol 4-phosphate cytidylyltransferase [Parapedobacter tibetensis]|uniref:2-C-methyl-D-erythritol 4-phosphate cytidylyltransferase n=1 Tax=Parapedobacter tibetensis TaxID=2972951 RepID=UPI00214DE715|nr:2-C-methyl-D-erythritol 4-phosphate cytidylyltransferase [Parapedobacter tibetensis]
MNYAIIVAGGTGSRMGSTTPKQFLLLNGIPVMMHAINAFYESKHAPHIIAVIHPDMQAYWLELCETYHFHVQHTIADGADSRFGSVKNGLEVIRLLDKNQSQSLIAIHDAVRPLVNPHQIDLTYEQAALTGAAALAIQSTNSIRLISGDGSSNNAYPRENVYLMQTPQIFKGSILFEAYEQPEDKMCTDDAAVVEKKGYPITLVDGDTRNIKITFRDDLAIAELLLEARHSGGTSDNSQ